MGNPEIFSLHARLHSVEGDEVSRIVRDLDHGTLRGLFDHVVDLISATEAGYLNEHVLLDDPWHHDEYPRNVLIRNVVRPVLAMGSSD